MLMLSVPCGHSLALYFTQVNFSPSSSMKTVNVILVFVLGVETLNIFQPALACGSCHMPTFFSRVSIGVRTIPLFDWNCIYDKHVLHFVVHVSISHSCSWMLCPPFCFWTVGICVTLQLVNWTPFFICWRKMYASLRWVRSTPPGTSEKQKVSQGKKHQRGRILNEIRRLEGSIFPSQYQ